MMIEEQVSYYKTRLKNVIFYCLFSADENYSSVTLNPDIHQDKLCQETYIKTNWRYFAMLNMTIIYDSEVTIF